MGLSVEAFISNLGTSAGYSSHTLQAYASDLHRFMIFLDSDLGHKPDLLDINPKHVSDFIKSERRGGLRESTLYRRRASIRRYVKFLLEGGLIERELFVEQSLSLPETLNSSSNSLKPSILTEEDIMRLREEIRSASNPRSYRDFAILNMLLETGISIAAMVRLELSDLNLRKNQIRLTIDEASDGTWCQIKDSLTPLHRYLVEGRPNLTDSLTETALFTSQMGGRMSRQGVWQVLRNWGEKAGLKQTLSPRLLRHTAVVRMVSNGLTISEIQRLIGHHNPLSTRALLRRLKISGKNHKKRQSNG